ncbi:glycerophosphodiester phosphodiesterase family protein [Pantoea eucalypti]|jgi:glycerophosphoryl diester phosphodiesterase|uniref:Glycerophosphoryl diester phosphodiesterase n=1 Tax=Pantoea eucalypti TaxID=470933 RepID=A0ABY2ZIV4_9GAMM|nr:MULTISPECIES: glycerophosphodiester phosphodiesterase family protein [Pantoea]PQL26878.1 glycerophosphoryl diester phosphodiesterase [Pantoea ananatis]QXG54810.1 glycerophosphoryl diester phosphodiesterase [Pantoea jilinensis]AWP31290.1 glycerophosphoryl diester phosphodiesterase [Pantoea vagans]EFM19014.1 glycerophosphoryl diester phosphodiesterase [Pantoea sp. aB]ELP24668.1 Glycerophosphoryl diester phosphodiesterase [Pantoea agglomerans 299R]
MSTQKHPARVVNSRLIAHRGAPLLAPENTLPSFLAAVEHGATWIEVDVKLTKDMHPVIIHDDSVNRTTNGKGYVANLTLDEIRSLEAGVCYGHLFRGVKVPTLAETVGFVLDKGVGLQLEIKPTSGQEVETAEIAIAQLKSLWPASEKKLFISSFSEISLQVAARLMPDVPRGLAVCVPPKDPAALLARTGCQILHFLGDFATDEDLARLARSGIEFAIATINDPVLARKYIDAGAQTVLSDIPDLAF